MAALFGRDGANPASPIGTKAGNAAAAIFVRIRQADQIQGGHGLQVCDSEPFPMLPQIFKGETAVAVGGGRFAAEQHGRDQERVLIKMALDLPFAHQSGEHAGVIVPTSFLLLVSIEHTLRWGKQRFMDVACAEDRTQEVCQIVALGKARQLGTVVEPHVHQTAYSGFFQNAEELLCRFLGETDGIDFHAGTVADSKSDS